jgi:hypothetical protein
MYNNASNINQYWNIRISTFCNVSNSGKDFFRRHQYVTNYNVSEADCYHPQANGMTSGWKCSASETLWPCMSTADNWKVPPNASDITNAKTLLFYVHVTVHRNKFLF